MNLYELFLSPKTEHHPPKLSEAYTQIMLDYHMYGPSNFYREITRTEYAKRINDYEVLIVNQAKPIQPHHLRACV
jgi:hypothetical protein